MTNFIKKKIKAYLSDVVLINFQVFQSTHALKISALCNRCYEVTFWKCSTILIVSEIGCAALM